MDGLAGDRSRQRWIVFSASFASFMVSLDTYVVNISLPTIARYFQVGTGGVSWVVLAYLLTITSTLLVFGRWADAVGLKRVFLLGLGVFTAGSLFCGAAPSLLMLVLARCVQGLGGSMLYAVAPAMISKFLPTDRRGSAYGIMSTLAALGITVGTPLGGLISGWLSWHWIFLINIPVGIAGVWVCRRTLPDDSRRAPAAREVGFDIPGAVLNGLGSGAFLYALNQGQEQGWASPRILSCLAAAAAMLAAFIAREKTAAVPLLDLSLFRDRAFTFGCLAGAMALAFLAGSNFLMPFYLEWMKGVKTQEAGLIIMSYSIVYMAVSLGAGRVADRINPRLLCMSGMAGIAAVSLLFSWRLEAGGLGPVFVFFVLLGVSFALFFSPNNKIVVGSAPAGRQGVVSGMFRMVLNLSMACGVCLFETIFSSVSQAPEQVSAAQAALLRSPLLSGFRSAYLVGAMLALLAVAFSALSKPRSSGA